MPVSRLDVMYRKLLLTQFFKKGWGNPENLLELFKFRRIMSNREKCYDLVPKRYPIKLINEVIRSDCRIIEGKFKSPFAVYMPKCMVPEIEDAYFQMVLPLKWEGEYKPMCIHLAGTGDHYFWRRRNMMAKPLLQKGIGAIILENPYYGLRKPPDQLRSGVHYVSDIFVMGGCLILECLTLLNWCEALGFGPLGISGISMGGHMASLAASNWPKPLVLVPCLSWSTASSVFTEGVMSESIDWDALQEQLYSDALYCDTLSKACKIVDSPFACSLSKITDVGFQNNLGRGIKSYNISPYEMNHYFSTMSKNRAVVTMYKSIGRSSKNDSEELFLEDEVIRFNSKKALDMKKRNTEALWFMRGMMDEFTHLKNFSVPYDPSLVISICAKSDAYVPRNGISQLEELWPGITVRYINTGHVGAYIWHRKLFRECIVEAFERAKKILPPPRPEFFET